MGQGTCNVRHRYALNDLARAVVNDQRQATERSRDNGIGALPADCDAGGIVPEWQQFLYWPIQFAEDAGGRVETCDQRG